MLVCICQPREIYCFMTLANFVLASSFTLKSRQILCSFCRYQEFQKQTRFSAPGVCTLKTVVANVTFNFNDITNDRDANKMVACTLGCSQFFFLSVTNNGSSNKCPKMLLGREVNNAQYHHIFC